MSKNFKSKKSSSNGKESGNCANSLKSTLQNKKVFRIPTHADGVLKVICVLIEKRVLLKVF